MAYTTKKTIIVHSLGKWLPMSMNWIYGQMKNLPEEHFELIVVCTEIENLNHFPINEIYSFYGENRLFNFVNRVLKKLKIRTPHTLLEKVLSKRKPDILHTHVGHRAYDNISIANKHKIKHISSFYGAEIKLPYEFAHWKENYHQLFEHIDQVFCEGPFMAKEIQKIGCPKDKITVQRLGIDLQKISFRPRNLTNKKHIKFLIIAPFREKKGITLALEALGKLKNEFNNFTVTIIGDASQDIKEQNEKEKIYQIILKLGLGSKVKMLGRLSYEEMIKESYNYDIFVSPSVTSKTDKDTEGGAPVTIIEMAASGMPIISTVHCDIPFVLASEYKHLLCPEYDIDCLLNKINFLLNNDFQELLIKNRIFIENNLDLNSHNFINCLENNYRKVLR